MIGEVLHVGVTVSDLDRSVEFYQNILGLSFQGELTMEGEATDTLFGRKKARARVAYLKGGDLISPPVELIQFTDSNIEKKNSDLFRTSISEICFYTDDMQATYDKLKASGVEFLSEPQDFDFTKDGFGKSRAVYFKDPDGVILELIQNIE